MPNKYNALEFKNYNKTGFASIFSEFLYLADEDRYDLASYIQKEIERIGLPDFLLVLAIYADEESDGLITTDKELQSGALVSQMASFYGNNQKQKSISSDPHKAFKQCQKHLERY